MRVLNISVCMIFFMLLVFVFNTKSFAQTICGASTQQQIVDCIADVNTDIVELLMTPIEITNDGTPNGLGVVTPISVGGMRTLQIVNATMEETAALVIDPMVSAETRFFEVVGGMTFTLDGVTLQGGNISSPGGAILNRNGAVTNILNSTLTMNEGTSGGAVENDSSTLNISNSIFGPDNNATAGFGGAINNTGNGILSISDSTIIGNEAENSDGGGVFNSFTLDITGSTIVDNTASSDGGGIFNEGTLTMSNTTIRENSAGNMGGGINNNGDATISTSTIGPMNQSDNNAGGISNNGGDIEITNSTISGNSAVNDGGGIRNGGSEMIVNNVTIADNSADNDGGGVWHQDGFTYTFANTIIADNSAINMGPDCFSDNMAPLDSQGFNLIESTDDCILGGIGTGNIIGMDPVLGPLQENPPDPPIMNPNNTATQALADLSPAIDVGNPDMPGAGFPACEETDQRGVLRNCDIGAFEIQMAQPTMQPTMPPTNPPTNPPTDPPTDSPTNPPNGGGGGGGAIAHRANLASSVASLLIVFAPAAVFGIVALARRRRSIKKVIKK